MSLEKIGFVMKKMKSLLLNMKYKILIRLLVTAATLLLFLKLHLLDLLLVLQTNVHQVVEDHEIAEVVEEGDDAQKCHGDLNQKA